MTVDELPATLNDLERQYIAVKLELLNHWLANSSEAKGLVAQYKGGLVGAQVAEETVITWQLDQGEMERIPATSDAAPTALVPTH